PTSAPCLHAGLPISVAHRLYGAGNRDRQTFRRIAAAALHVDACALPGLCAGLVGHRISHYGRDPARRQGEGAFQDIHAVAWTARQYAVAEIADSESAGA